MKTVVLHNPRSGRGLGARLAERVRGVLRARGHRVKELTVGGAEGVDPVLLADADAFVIIGGDGSVAYQAEAAAEAGTPVYHAGTGNENLFARQFRMSREPVAVVKAVERRNVANIDLADVSGRSMLLMAGIGPDAGVIRRLTNVRTKAIGHAAYIEPIVREGLRPDLKRFSAWVDGEPFVEDQRGQFLIANSPMYAARANPASRALMDDGLLDAVFMPCKTAVTAAAWLGAARARLARRINGWRETRGREIRVEWAGDPGAVQIDGEWASDIADTGFSARVRQKPLPVLIPAGLGSTSKAR